MIFAFWRPALLLVGRVPLRVAFQALPFTFQAKSVLTQIPPEFFQALPYVMTIVVLVAVSSAGEGRRERREPGVVVARSSRVVARQHPGSPRAPPYRRSGPWKSEQKP